MDVERRVAHAVSLPQHRHRQTAFGLPQDRDDLRLSVSACLHSKFLRSSWRENSTYTALCFRGRDWPRQPPHQFRDEINRLPSGPRN